MPRPKTRKPAAPYHHGDLRSALLGSALTVLSESGVEGFSLRETARRAGVSSAAPKHHFADARALFTALAAKAFEELADRLGEADGREENRDDAIRAQGIAYVMFALDNPALFNLMWRAALLDFTDPPLMREKARSFGVLDARVRGADAPPLPHGDPAMAPTYACWSTVHGFAHMALEGAFGPDLASARATLLTLLPAAIDLIDF